MSDASQQSVPSTQNTESLSILRHRLETQSFLQQPNSTLLELKNWWRFTPTLNWLVLISGIMMASPILLFIQAGLMFSALILPSHPFDWLYNYAIRFVTGTAALPKSGQRRKVMFAFACILTALLGIWFQHGYTMLAYIQGAIMAALGGLLAAFNLCVLSEILSRMFGMPAH